MRQYGIIYKSYEKLKAFINYNKIDKDDTVLIQIFVGVVDKKFIENLIGEILSILPNAEIIGATTDGEIYKNEITTQKTVISFTVFEKTKIKSKLLVKNNNDEYKLGVDLVHGLVEEDTKIVILFAEVRSINGFELIRGIESVNNKVVICGGKAGNDGNVEETLVFTKEGICTMGVAAISLTGKELNVLLEHNLGWSAIGKYMTVTEAINNRVHTIDGVKALEVYKKYLGDDVAKGLPMSANEFPLIVKENEIEMARVAGKCYEDGSLYFYGDIKTNDKVQFGYTNINILNEKAAKIANKLKKKKIEAIFVYSCSVRRNIMQDQMNFEIEPLNDIAPTFGFFTYGEFYNANGKNRLLNLTMTILAISEGEQELCDDELKTEQETNVNSVFQGKEFRTIKAFTNLVNQATSELQQINEALIKQKQKIEQMHKITKSILEINSDMISSGEFDQLLQAILDKTMEIIPSAKMGSILFLEDGILSYKATKNYVNDEVKYIEYKLEDTYLYKNNSMDSLFYPTIIRDIETNLFDNIEYFQLWGKMLKEPPKELLTYGIGIDGQFMGVINLYNTEGDISFNEEDKNLIKYLCYDIAIALRNYKLFRNILYMSRYDNLTGLYNRHHFSKLLKQYLKEAKLSRKNLVVGVIDLNNLKSINDTYGHEAGDEFLVRFSEVFKREIREDEIIGRTGGDEFYIAFINKDIQQATEIIEKVSQKLKQKPLDFNGDKKIVTFAYGLAECSTYSEDIKELLSLADKRMYSKKRTMKEE